MKIAIVKSRFNEDITTRLFDGAFARLQELGVEKNNITSVEVPGAIEIPITAQCLAKTKIYDAIIAIGAVIQGATDHYQYVCQQVSDGCQHVALTYDIPVIFAVLTTRSHLDALDRSGGKKAHLGREAADIALEMIDKLQTISNK